MQPKEGDKVIFRQAANVIAQTKSADVKVNMAALPGRTYQWIFFYAHRNYPGPLCHEDVRVPLPDAPVDLSGYFASHDVRYVIYEEQQWRRHSPSLIPAFKQLGLHPVGKWPAGDTPQIILYEVPPASAEQTSRQ